MEHCMLCHHPFIPDIRGMEPSKLTFGEEEDFIVHGHCASEVTENYRKFRGAKRDFYVRMILNKLSN